MTKKAKKIDQIGGQMNIVFEYIYHLKMFYRFDAASPRALTSLPLLDDPNATTPNTAHCRGGG
jgi:hypothetical protein